VFIDSYHAIFHQVWTVLHELQYGSAVDSAKRKLYREAKLDSDVVVGLWLKGVTLSETLAAIRDLEPARLKTWAEHDAVWNLRERHPGPEDPRELEMIASAEAYVGAMERLRVARRESGIESERPLFVDDEFCEQVLRWMTDRRQALNDRVERADVAAKAQAAAVLKEQEIQETNQKLANKARIAQEKIAQEVADEKHRRAARDEATRSRLNRAIELLKWSIPFQLLVLFNVKGWSALVSTELWLGLPTFNAVVYLALRSNFPRVDET
jgi:hypothetical protein